MRANSGMIPLARNMAPATQGQTPAVAVADATTALLSVTVVSGAATIELQWSNDKSNWAMLAQWPSLESGFYALTPVSGIAGGFLRATVTVILAPLVLGVLNLEILLSDA